MMSRDKQTTVHCTPQTYRLFCVSQNQNECELQTRGKQIKKHCFKNLIWLCSIRRNNQLISRAHLKIQLRKEEDKQKNKSFFPWTPFTTGEIQCSCSGDSKRWT